MHVVSFVAVILFLAGAPDEKPDQVIVRVGEAAITTGDVDFLAMQMGLTPEQRKEREPKLVEQLIQRQLIRAFLAAKKIDPPVEDLQYQISRAEDLIRKRGDNPEKLLAHLGFTPSRLKSELGLPLAWQVYVRQSLKPEQLKEYYQRHKQELDGTQVRARQIFLKLSPEKQLENSAIAEKKQLLTELRQKILDGKLAFVEAAKQNSEAPTAENGGDVGLFSWRGKLPPTVSQAAFGLEVNEISQPITSPFGLHLIQVTERHPGEYSFEDVRTEIIERLSQELWKTTVEKERSTVKIDRK